VVETIGENMAIRKNSAATVGVGESVRLCQENGQGCQFYQLYVRAMPARSDDDPKAIDAQSFRHCIRDTERALSSMRSALGFPGTLGDTDGPFVVNNDMEVFGGFMVTLEHEDEQKRSQLNSVVRMAAVLLRENGYRVRMTVAEPMQMVLPETGDMSLPTQKSEVAAEPEDVDKAHETQDEIGDDLLI
jgi:hypothetical protein